MVQSQGSVAVIAAMLLLLLLSSAQVRLCTPFSHPTNSDQFTSPLFQAYISKLDIQSEIQARFAITQVTADIENL